MPARQRTAVIFGGSGAVGSAVAHALARRGDRVFIGARRPDRLAAVAAAIRASGASAETFAVDVLDEAATIAAVARIAAQSGGIDIAMNATGFMHDQGTELGGLTLDAFMRPLTTFLPAQFITAKAVAPHMGGRGPGVIVTLTAPAARLAVPGHLGHIVATAAEEAFARVLASELGPRDIRVVCLRSHAIAGAAEAGSYTATAFAPKAEAMGLSVAEWLEGAARGTMLGRLPTLSQIADTVAFLTSQSAGAMTATVVNMTAGLVAD